MQGHRRPISKYNHLIPGSVNLTRMSQVVRSSYYHFDKQLCCQTYFLVLFYTYRLVLDLDFIIEASCYSNLWLRKKHVTDQTT